MDGKFHIHGKPVYFNPNKVGLNDFLSLNQMKNNISYSCEQLSLE